MTRISSWLVTLSGRRGANAAAAGGGGPAKMRGIDMSAGESDVLTRFSAQIGELAQHHLVASPDINETGDWYLRMLHGVIDRNGSHWGQIKPRYLEIGCWQFILGYQLAKDRGFESTLFDICDLDLERGRARALAAGYADGCDRVVGDFHDLPFADGYFDLVMISAAIHHTRTPERIIGEMMRVLSDGGLFYCQREPAERLFCFYSFAANRPSEYTPFEKHLHDRDVMRLFSSPFPGARNAALFDRVENDRIILDRYYAVFEKYGHIVEQVLYYDGFLTSMDKEILAAAEKLDEPALVDFIAAKVDDEVDLATPLLGNRERLMGYSLPTRQEVQAKAVAVANALKARPARSGDPLSFQQAMTRIFGGSLRFVVQRDGPGRVDRKFRRTCTEQGSVRYDDAVYVNSGLRFWDKLLPDIQEANLSELHAKSFPASDWRVQSTGGGPRSMIATAYAPTVAINVATRAVLVTRIRVVVDQRLEAAYLDVACGDECSTSLIALTEDRMLRFVLAPGANAIQFKLRDLEGRPVSAASRVRISIFQAIPIME